MRRLALVLIALLPLVAQAALQKGVIEVGAVKGASILKDASGRSANLTKGLTFKEGHRIETAAGATAELIFSNGATILVNPETQIEIKIFSQVASPLIIAGKYKELSAEPSMSIVQIELYRGKIIGEARKLNPSTQFTVKTPVGLTRVRGTVWTDEYTYDDKLQVGQQTTTVVRGEVEVNDLNGSLPTPIIGGQEIVITGPAEKPERELGTDVPAEPGAGTGTGTGGGTTEPKTEEPKTTEPKAEEPKKPAGPLAETKTEVKQADPEKIKEVVQDFKGGTTTPPPPPTPPGGTTEPGTGGGTTEPGTGGGTTEPGTGGGTTEPEPEPEKPKPPTPPAPPPPPPPPPPVIDDIVEKETQENLSPSGG